MTDFTHNRGSHWKPRGMLFNLRISEKLLQTNKKCGFTNQLKGGIAPGGKGDNITETQDMQKSMPFVYHMLNIVE